MKSTLKMLAFTIALLALIIGSVLLQSCVLSKFISGQKVETFTLVLYNQEITVQLPSEVSKDKFGSMEDHRCWNARLCVKIYRYNVNDEPGFEHVNFWYTSQDGKPKFFGLVWVSRTNTRQLKRHLVWLYDKEVPIPSTEQRLNEIINELYLGKGKGSSDTI